MAQIVCIDTGTVLENISEIDDVIAIHDDDVELSGAGYTLFCVLTVTNKTAEEIQAGFAAKVPEQKESEKDGKRLWLHSDGKWYELAKEPKYAISLRDWTEVDRIALEAKETTVEDRNIILAKACEKIHLDNRNMTEVSD